MTQLFQDMWQEVELRSVSPRLAPKSDPGYAFQQVVFDTLKLGYLRCESTALEVLVHWSEELQQTSQCILVTSGASQAEDTDPENVLCVQNIERFDSSS